MKREYPIEEEWISYELHPETPEEGILLAVRFPDYDLEGLFNELRAKGARYGYEFGNVTLLSNSKMALEASEFARDHGKYDEFHSAVFHAYFTLTRDIGQLEVLLDLARATGLDPEQLRQALESRRYEARLEKAQEDGERHLVSVLPTFIFDDREKLVGLRHLQAFRDAIDKLG